MIDAKDRALLGSALALLGFVLMVLVVTAAGLGLAWRVFVAVAGFGG